MGFSFSVPAYGFLNKRAISSSTQNFLAGLIVGASSCLAATVFFAKKLFSIEPARSAHDQRLLTAGVSAYMLPYVKNATRIGNISYIHLDSVNQFDTNVNAPVDEYQKKVIEKETNEHNVTEVAHLPQEKKYTIESFSPHGTCAVQAIRNSKLMNRLVGLQNRSSILDLIDRLLGRPDRKTETLKQLRETEHAQGFLRQEVTDNLATSWLSGGDLARRLQDHYGRYGLEANSVDVQEVSSFILTDGPAYLRDRLAPRGAYNGGDFTYTFIICTGDIERLEAMNPAYTEFAHEYRIANPQEVALLKGQVGNPLPHYYVLTLVKKDNNITCYIVDTIPTNDHINNEFFLQRNRYFCEKLLTNESDIDFRIAVREYAKSRLKEMMTTMSLNGLLSYDKI